MCDSATTSEILKHFHLLCSVPHGSGNEKALSNRICEKLYELGLSPNQDNAGNIVCDIAGAEGAPLVALQAHLDMVCAVGAPSYQPATDPIRPIQQDGWLRTAGESSLGADCGAGVAVMLWLASHDEFPHPPLRLIFTVKEEIGLQGAIMIDPACMEGVTHFINLDGFSFDTAVIGAAGGVRITMSRPIETEPAPSGLHAYTLTLSGLRGGHSGEDIDSGRGNAISLLGGALREYGEGKRLYLAAIRCGTASNAIPAQASCVLVTDGNPTSQMQQFNARLALFYSKTDPDARFEIAPCEMPETVYTEELSRAIIGLMTETVSGVFQYHEDFEELVGDSANFGVLRAEGGKIVARSMIRFSTDFGEENLVGQHEFAAECNGFSFEIDNRYPAWPAQPDCPLLNLVRNSYRQATGQELNVSIRHVGLEPAIFYSYNPDAQFVNLGMTILDCHSPRERWAIDTIGPFSDMLRDMLAALASA